jgi:hypothetical protein
MNNKFPLNLHSKKFYYLAIILLFVSYVLFSQSSLYFINNHTSASAQEPADLNNDNTVNVFDLSILISNWNTNNTTADINKDGTVNIFDLSALISKWGTVMAQPQGASSFYGPSFGADAIANINMGGSENIAIAYRFVADSSSTLVAFRPHMKAAGESGYSGGTYGTIRASIRTDNNGYPTGTSLANTDFVYDANWPEIQFSNPPALTKGTAYHIVFTNIDPKPTINFFSLNHMFRFAATTPQHPNRNDSDWHVAISRNGGAWGPVSGGWGSDNMYSPDIDLRFANGSHQGQGYIDVDTANGCIIAGANNMCREGIVVSGGDKNFSSVGVRIAKTSGNGNLIVRLENGDGSLIDSVSMPVSSVPVFSRTLDSEAGRWIEGSFSRNVTLANGSTYYLRLSTDSSTSLWTRGIQGGVSWPGFHPSTVFTDGFMQYTTNGGSTWDYIPGLGGEDGDLQFYLK